MQVVEVMAELEAMGSPQTRKMYTNHGAKGEMFGVKIGDMKKIVKKVKKDHDLALALFATGNHDAMYLAGLIADEKRVSPDELDHWAQSSDWYMVSEYAIAGLAAESPYGWELATRWIRHESDPVSSTGWATLGGWVSIRDNADLDLAALEGLLDHVCDHIGSAPNRTRYTMNGFVIGVGAYVPALTEKALAVAHKIGKVDVDVGGTSCKVPLAVDYIKKIEKAGRIGKKRKYVRC